MEHTPVLRRPPPPAHPSSTAYRSVLAAEGLFKAHHFAHDSMVPIRLPAATPRCHPRRFLCLVVALEHANEISRFSLKTEGVRIGRPRPSRATPGGTNLPNGTNPRRTSRTLSLKSIHPSVTSPSLPPSFADLANREFLAQHLCGFITPPHKAARWIYVGARYNSHVTAAQNTPMHFLDDPCWPQAR